MDERSRRLLNPTETIVSHLPLIIEAFVEFYGEEERENITNKFNHMLVIGYSNPHDINSMIIKIDNQKSDEIKESFLSRCATREEEKVKLKQLFFYNASLQHNNLHPINEYIEYKENPEENSYKRNNVVKFLKQIYPETTEENVDELIASGTFQSIDTLIPIYKEELNKYHKFQEDIKPYQDYADKCMTYEQELSKKYTKILIESLKDLFNETEYIQVSTIMNKNSVSLWDLGRLYSGKINNYFGTNFQYGIPLIYAFNDENEEILQTSANGWKKDSIKKDRIKYFKNLGLDLGDDYESYINDPRAKELTPSKELISRIANTKNDLYTKMMNEYYTSLPEYKQNREKINNLDLLEKDDGYDAKLFENNFTCMLTNLKLENGEYIEHPIVLICLRSDDEYLDHFLIHELNHMYELKLISIENGECKYFCGFEKLNGKINGERENNVPLEADEGKRNNELFSEIINELIAQEISEILTQKGIYIFNTRENKKIKGATEYEKTKFLVLEFYETYKKEILEARKTGNIEILYDAVGKENLEELNQLFHEYYDNFYVIGPFAMLKVYEDLQNNIDTPETIKYKELKSRRDVILANMKEHYQSQSKKR